MTQFATFAHAEHLKKRSCRAESFDVLLATLLQMAHERIAEVDVAVRFCCTGVVIKPVGGLAVGVPRCRRVARKSRTEDSSSASSLLLDSYSTPTRYRAGQREATKMGWWEG